MNSHSSMQEQDTLLSPQEDYLQYFPEGKDDHLWGLTVKGCGHAVVPPQCDYPFLEHPFGYEFDWQEGRKIKDFQIYLISKGAGHVAFEKGKANYYKAPFVFVVFPDTWHSFRPSKKCGWEEHWISFKGESANRFMSEHFFDRNRPIFHLNKAESLQSSFDNVHQLSNALVYGQKQLLASAAMTIAAKLRSLGERKRMENTDDHAVIVKKAEVLLQEKCQQHVDIEELASQFDVSYSFFRRIFKKYTGFAPNQYHLNLRLERAKTLLGSTQLSITEISAELGFDNPYHFSTLFKRKVGESPKEFRLRNMETA